MCRIDEDRETFDSNIKYQAFIGDSTCLDSISQTTTVKPVAYKLIIIVEKKHNEFPRQTYGNSQNKKKTKC